MSNPAEGTAFGSRISMTEDSHSSILERCRSSADLWDMEDTKPSVEALERGVPGLYLSCFDMLLTEDTPWLVKVSEASSTQAVPMTRMEPREEPEQCPIIDSQEQGLSPGLEGQEEDRSLEQVQSMVVGEVLKDIETACKLLNITPGRPAAPAAAAPLLQQNKHDIFHCQKIILIQRHLSYWIFTPKINTYLC